MMFDMEHIARCKAKSKAEFINIVREFDKPNGKCMACRDELGVLVRHISEPFSFNAILGENCKHLPGLQIHDMMLKQYGRKVDK